MSTTHGASRLLLFGAALLASAGLAARSTDDWRRSANGCVAGDEDDGRIVYDAGQGLCWLADANLAGDPAMRKKLGVAGINPNGSMDWPTALDWVDALNALDGGWGYLGHNNWQLPVTPKDDDTCSAKNDGSFGPTCTGSALGDLYSRVLNRAYPDSVVPDFVNEVGPFRNLVPALYWTSDSGGGGGENTFSFATGLHGANTTRFNYLHVLPMIRGAIGTPPGGTGVRRYTNGDAAGKAVFDTQTGVSWLLDANLAARNTFGLTGTTSVQTDHGTALTVPLIDVDGAMLFDTAHGRHGWIDAMNDNGYAGTSAWQLPSGDDLDTLFHDLGLQPGSVRFESRTPVARFRNFQPFFYWACERDATGTTQSPCNPRLHPPDNPVGGAPMRWSFDFDDGFQGTDKTTKQFYVEVYYPAPR